MVRLDAAASPVEPPQHDLRGLGLLSSEQSLPGAHETQRQRPFSERSTASRQYLTRSLKTRVSISETVRRQSISVSSRKGC